MQRRHYLAIFAISLALLMLEIAAARILSVALFSHYAFVAVSLAMFGIGLSGLLVYLFPNYFSAARLDDHLVLFSSAFAASAAGSVVVFLRIHVVQELSLTGLLTVGLAYAVLVVPYLCGGICISLLMTHCASRIGRIYFADLVGASLGCLGVVGALQILPAPQVAVLVAAIVAVIALLLAIQSGRPRGVPLAACAVVGAIALAAAGTDLLRMRYVKTWTTFYSAFEGWNAFSRVAAFPSENNAAQLLPLRNPPKHYTSPPFPKSMNLDIDGAAWTPMMNYDGDRFGIQFLRESVLYVVHHLKRDASVLIIGTGGGRDILAAVAAGQPSITGIEINPLMERVVQHEFADYSGRPYTLPGVEVIIDEARSHLSTLERKFDVIQLSLIDTFSLNAAGGFVFSENYLYTREGFQEYFEHLADDGILTVTRYYNAHYPVETVRIAGMMRAAWEAEGIADASRHVAVLSHPDSATMLAKRSPFTADEIAALRRVAADYNMKILYVPGTDAAADPIAAALTVDDFAGFAATYPFLISPPTDDAPFFFHVLRGPLAPEEIPSMESDPFQFLRKWHEAVILLYMLIGVVSFLAVMCFFAPLVLFARRGARNLRTAAAPPLLLYFACLGYGFMMIEIPLLQRFMLLLGYPVYALAVVLFSLLLFSGIGSLISSRFAAAPRRALVRVLSAILALAAVYVFAIPVAIEAFLGTPILLRIAVTVALLAPIGVLLGMAYPLGIGVLRGFAEELVPWAWGLNGALSVVASVFAIFLGSRYGFRFAFLTGVAAYGVALVVMLTVPLLTARARPVQSEAA